MIDKHGPDSLIARATFQLDLSPESQLLQQQSFVDPEHTWEMPAKDVRPYRFWKPYNHAYSYRLSEDSYLVLAAKCGIEPQRYNTIAEIKERSYEGACEWYLLSSGSHIRSNPISGSSYGIENCDIRTPPSSMALVSGATEPINMEGRHASVPIDYFNQYPSPPLYPTFASHATRYLQQTGQPSPSSSPRLNPVSSPLSPHSFPSRISSTLQQPRRPSLPSPLVSRLPYHAPTSVGFSIAVFKGTPHSVDTY